MNWVISGIDNESRPLMEIIVNLIVSIPSA